MIGFFTKSYFVLPQFAQNHTFRSCWVQFRCTKLYEIEICLYLCPCIWYHMTKMSSILVLVLLKHKSLCSRRDWKNDQNCVMSMDLQFGDMTQHVWADIQMLASQTYASPNHDSTMNSDAFTPPPRGLQGLQIRFTFRHGMMLTTLCWEVMYLMGGLWINFCGCCLLFEWFMMATRSQCKRRIPIQG